MFDWLEFSIEELKAPTKNAIAMGPFGSRIKVENFVKSGIPVIKGGNLNGDFILEDKFDFLTEEKATELKTSNAFRRDIVITHRGTIGQVGIIPDNSKFKRYVVSQSQLKVTLDQEKVNPYFVYYFLRSPLGQHRLLVNASQVGVPAIAQASTSVKCIKVPCPSKDIQNKVVEILLNLDHKIELNRQTNQTLEQIVQAIFKSWFVDFEPVKAKIAAKQAGATPEQIERAAMCAISGKSFEALEQLSPETLQQLKTTAALFPDALVESELGEIPEGWEVKTIDDVTSLIIDHRGKTPKKLGGDWTGSGYPVLSAKIIKAGRIVNRQSIRFVNDEMYSRWMKDELEIGDVLITSEAPMGEMFFLTNDVKYCLSQRLYALRTNNQEVTSSYLYLWLHSARAQADLEGRATGTTVVGIRQVELRKISVLTPNYRLLSIFEKMVFPLLCNLYEKEDENISLGCLRDELLPKLLSGEITIAHTHSTEEAMA